MATTPGVEPEAWRAAVPLRVVDAEDAAAPPLFLLVPRVAPLASVEARVRRHFRRAPADGDDGAVAAAAGPLDLAKSQRSGRAGDAAEGESRRRRGSVTWRLRGQRWQNQRKRRSSRGGAAAWRCGGDESRRRRGHDVDIPWGRVAAPPRLRRGHSVGTSRAAAAATTWTFYGDGSSRRG